MAVGRYRYGKQLLEEQISRKKRLRLYSGLEPYMHNELIYYGNTVTTGSSTYMPAVWNPTYTNSGYVYNGGTIQWNPAPPPAPPAHQPTPMEWLDEQVNAVCRRSGL